ncbi:hypothetical protein G7046_g6969 [Stylonectria norvegica]|nr:hypothetical protein G7046_g6969 [Stylonectria norvegica]
MGSIAVHHQSELSWALTIGSSTGPPSPDDKASHKHDQQTYLSSFGQRSSTVSIDGGELSIDKDDDRGNSTNPEDEMTRAMPKADSDQAQGGRSLACAGSDGSPLNYSQVPGIESMGHQRAMEAEPQAATPSQDVARREMYNLLHTMIGGDPFAGVGAADFSGGTEMYWSFWHS